MYQIIKDFPFFESISFTMFLTKGKMLFIIKRINPKNYLINIELNRFHLP